MNFPAYRKYRNGLSWFKISGPETFTEIRKVGSRYLVSEHTVKILPERNMLHDLLHDYHSFAVEIEPSEYEGIYGLTGQSRLDSGR